MRLALIGVACLGLAGLTIALADDTALLRSLSHLLALPIAVGVVAIGLAAARVTMRWLEAQPADTRESRLGTIVGVVGLGGLGAAFAVYSLSIYWKRTQIECWDAWQGETVEERAAALHRGKQRLGSVFSLLPEAVGFRVSATCEEAERDLARVRSGLCPRYMMRSWPCRCGGDSYPADARCEHPQCQVGANPEQLVCW